MSEHVHLTEKELNIIAHIGNDEVKKAVAAGNHAAGRHFIEAYVDRQRKEPIPEKFRQIFEHNTPPDIREELYRGNTQFVRDWIRHYFNEIRRQPLTERQLDVVLKFGSESVKELVIAGDYEAGRTFIRNTLSDWKQELADPAKPLLTDSQKNIIELYADSETYKKVFELGDHDAGRHYIGLMRSELHEIEKDLQHKTLFSAKEKYFITKYGTIDMQVAIEDEKYLIPKAFLCDLYAYVDKEFKAIYGDSHK